MHCKIICFLIEILLHFLFNNVMENHQKSYLCNLKVILRHASSLKFCSKISLNFVWSEILLQRHGVFAFFAIILTWTTSTDWKFRCKMNGENTLCISGCCPTSFSILDLKNSSEKGRPTFTQSTRPRGRSKK